MNNSNNPLEKQRPRALGLRYSIESKYKALIYSSAASVGERARWSRRRARDANNPRNYYSALSQYLCLLCLSPFFRPSFSLPRMYTCERTRNVASKLSIISIAILQGRLIHGRNRGTCNTKVGVAREFGGKVHNLALPHKDGSLLDLLRPLGKPSFDVCAFRAGMQLVANLDYFADETFAALLTEKSRARVAVGRSFSLLCLSFSLYFPLTSIVMFENIRRAK